MPQQQRRYKRTFVPAPISRNALCPDGGCTRGVGRPVSATRDVFHKQDGEARAHEFPSFRPMECGVGLPYPE